MRWVKCAWLEMQFCEVNLVEFELYLVDSSALCICFVPEVLHCGDIPSDEDTGLCF